jgi:hypothetical protein
MAAMKAPMIYGNVYADGHHRNSLFAQQDSVHKHNPTDIPRSVRDALLQLGIEINTPDLNEGREVAFDLHFEGRPLAPTSRPRFLVALENPYLLPLNADPQYASQFTHVFGWDSRLSVLPQFTPLRIPHPLRTRPFKAYAERGIFSCLINANKAFKTVLPSDLYIERLNTIRWYEQHAPGHFELYGLGWDKLPPAFSAGAKLRRAGQKLAQRVMGRPAFPSYRGEVADKATALENAKFSYVYENSRGLDDYITEKIFDSLVCGCIPVYWGADNIADRIPADCFIDRRQFSTTAVVHEFLLSMKPPEFEQRQAAIQDFLASAQARECSLEVFAKSIAHGIEENIRRGNLVSSCGSTR